MIAGLSATEMEPLDLSLRNTTSSLTLALTERSTGFRFTLQVQDELSKRLEQPDSEYY